MKNGVVICGSMFAKNNMREGAMESRMGAMTHKCKMQGIERENSTGIAIWARTDSGDRGLEDAAEQNAGMSVLHENEGRNSGPERSCTKLGDAKT
jgi:hypothetical protein